MQSEPWYGVKLIYRLTGMSRPSYEERVILIRASSDAEAIAEAERRSTKYEDDTTHYTGYLMAFNIFDESGPGIGEGVEVFSSIRYSDLDTDAYLNRFYDTGDECCQ